MVRSKRASPAVLKLHEQGDEYPHEQGEIKAGGMRVPKKHEYGPVGKNAKPSGKDKTSAITSFSKPQNMGVLVAEALSKMNHKMNAAALQVAQQKPQPALEKFILPKRIHIIQQPRKC
uniref:Uncharacterized protein n=1 Tax=Melopsittacus undulatus TaxID=13146 RepID=A0A8C6JLW8_MELUD